MSYALKQSNAYVFNGLINRVYDPDDFDISVDVR